MPSRRCPGRPARASQHACLQCGAHVVTLTGVFPRCRRLQLSTCMALTLEQYATYLDSRALTWPAPPDVEAPKARPHLVRLPDVRAVTWSVYGTLLAISGGELYFEHPKQFIMDVALDK